MIQLLSVWLFIFNLLMKVDPGEKVETILEDDTVKSLLDDYEKLQAEGSLLGVTEKATIDISALNLERTSTSMLLIVIYLIWRSFCFVSI